MLSCGCLFLFGCLVFILFGFLNKNKKEKSEKYKNSVFVYIGTCVPWMAIETKFSKLCISCSLDERVPWMAIETKFSKLCISCSLDEHLYAQLSK